jgi:putative hydrolase of the HAD superfamily
VTKPTAILFDAGGVLIFPDPARVLPPLNDAGFFPSHDDLIRAHYYAMRATERDSDPNWWAAYLRQYIISCGVPADGAGELATHMASTINGFAWTHVNPVARETLAALIERGTPIGIVSNADGNVQQALCELGVCHVPGTAADGCVTVGTVIDSAVVGVSKPDPGIFSFALNDMSLQADAEIIYVGDTLRYDVTGASAAGLTPVHLDPFGDCSAPDGHAHIQSLPDILALCR